MTPEKAVEIYCDDCKHRHLSEKSIRHSLIIFRHFADYCRLHNLDDLRDAVPETLHDFYRWIKQRKRPDGEPISTKHINRHVRLVKILFKFLAGRNLIMADIGKNFPPLHDPHTLPRGIMDKDQVMKLLQQPLMTTPLGFRDRTMFEVLYSTGLRGGELCRLSLYDFDPQERMIRVLGKGNKERIVPVGKVAASYLIEYLKSIRPILLAPSQKSAISNQQSAIPTVFLSATGRKLRPGDLHRILKAYREKAGLPDTITTHSLRHTCATEMLKGGASIRHVQELLGHADIQTTQIYTHVVPTDLKKAHARTSPSERRKNVEKVEFTPGGAVRWNDNKNAKYWPKVHHFSARADPPGAGQERNSVQERGESGTN